MKIYVNLRKNSQQSAQLTNNQYITYNNKKYRTLKRLIITYLASKIGKTEHLSKKHALLPILL